MVISTFSEYKKEDYSKNIEQTKDKFIQLLNNEVNFSSDHIYVQYMPSKEFFETKLNLQEFEKLFPTAQDDLGLVE